MAQAEHIAEAIRSQTQQGITALQREFFTLEAYESLLRQAQLL